MKNNSGFSPLEITAHNVERIADRKKLSAKRYPLTAKTGFTLIEIFIVILILALLIAVAMPNFIKTRNEVIYMTCLSNLRKLDDSVNRYAVSSGESFGDEVFFTDIIPGFLKIRPQCPAEGTYALNLIGQKPTCSVEGHELP